MNTLVLDTPSKVRLLLGGFIFVTGFASPLLIPLVINSELPDDWKTLLSGFLALGIPEIFMLIAAGILGKQGLAYLKSKLWTMIQPAETVGLLRYRVGLLMLLIPILFIWLHPYLEQAQPELAEQRMLLALISDTMVVVSLFVLGGEFWDKLRNLFIYDMSVVQTPEPSATKAAIAKTAAKPPMSRLLIGGMFFSLSLFLPAFIPLLSYLPVSDEVHLVTGGLMVFGIPQALMLLTISILRKPGFAYLKLRLGGLLPGLLTTRVSQRRYRLGLILLAAPLLLGITWPYLSMMFDSLHLYKYEMAMVGDVILILAVFILGGEFWEKLISLFHHRSRVTNIPVS